MPPELIRLAEVGSTMEAAHEAAGRGASHGTAVVAEVQTAGRGTRGRSWASGRGGLWLSVVARPRHPEAIEALSLRVGLALAATLERALPSLPRLELKWPNDLLLDRRKLAGILCEARWAGEQCQWVVIGVGVNVGNTIPPALAPHATRLVDWVPTADAAALAPTVAEAIAAAGREARALTQAELDTFAQRDVLAGQRVSAPLVGTAEGITAAGALRVRLDSGPVREVLGGVASTPL